MDNAAGVVAFRHCLTNVVTVSLEAMNFTAPIYNGSLVFISAQVIFVSQKYFFSFLFFFFLLTFSNKKKKIIQYDKII